MEQLRTYDPALVEAIGAKSTSACEGTLICTVKPIPDDDRDHVLDPRVRATAARKAAMFSQRAHKRGGMSLSDERYRPDKATPDLTISPIEQWEQIIPVGKTHRIPVHFYRPETLAPQAPFLLYLHGGGFTAGDERIYRNRMRFIAEQSGALVAFPEYRLAPEAPFPAAIDDACATLDWALDHASELGFDPARVMVAGDSAGGSLSCAVVLKDAEKRIASCYLVFPGCDMSNLDELEAYSWSYDDFPVIDEDRELAYGRIARIERSCHTTAQDSLYVQGKTSLKDPLVSVAYATDEQLAAFPPTVVAVSEYDYLRLGAEYFAHRLAAAGVPTELVTYKGCDHGFFDLFGSEPQSEELAVTIAQKLSDLA